jgi:hypothetical protein
MEDKSKKIEIKLLQEKYPEAPKRFLEEFLSFAWVTDSADAFLKKTTTAFYAKRSIAEMILWRIRPGEKKLKAIATKREVSKSIEHSTTVDPKILSLISCLARQKRIKDKIELLEDLGNNEKLDRQKEELLQKLKDEEQAISDWLDCKQEPYSPTTWDVDVLKKFPSEYLEETKKAIKPNSTHQGAPTGSGQKTDQGFAQSAINHNLTFIQVNKRLSADTTIQNIDNSVAIHAPTTTINTELDTRVNEDQPEQTVSPESQDNLDGNIHKQPTQQPEKTNADIIGKVNILKKCGYPDGKNNWTAIKRHCRNLNIKIRHVDDKLSLDPLLKESDCNLICSRKLEKRMKKFKKMEAGIK